MVFYCLTFSFFSQCKWFSPLRVQIWFLQNPQNMLSLGEIRNPKPVNIEQQKPFYLGNHFYFPRKLHRTMWYKLCKHISKLCRKGRKEKISVMDKQTEICHLPYVVEFANRSYLMVYISTYTMVAFFNSDLISSQRVYKPSLKAFAASLKDLRHP